MLLILTRLAGPDYGTGTRPDRSDFVSGPVPNFETGLHVV